MVTGACAAVWLVVPVAFLLATPAQPLALWAFGGMMALWGLSLAALAWRKPTLLLWAIGTRALLDPLALLLGPESGFPWACVAFLADVGALLVAFSSLPWTARSDQGGQSVSDPVQVRSYLLEIGRPALAAVVALVASLAVAFASSLFDLGTLPLAVVAVTSVIALVSLAALLAWNSKGL
jgi:hypothetical protein